MPSSARCPATIGGGSPLPLRTKWLGSLAPAATSTLDFVPAALVITRVARASEMHWASMGMQYTASLPNMQAKLDGTVKRDNKKKEYKCPCPGKVCNYPVVVCVKCIIYASAIRMAGTQILSFTPAK